jgi:hypothetical protein
MPKDARILGTGHPNLILESDYADSAPAKSKRKGKGANKKGAGGFRVETRVNLDQTEYLEVERLLGLGDAGAADLVKYLKARVKGGNPTGRKRAKKMIAAAFGKR